MSGELKKFSSEFFIYGISSLINRGVQVLMLPLIFDYLTKEQFGTLDFFLTTKNLLFTLLGWGILTAIMRFSAKFSNYDFSDVLSNSVIAMVMIFFLGGIILYFSLPIINNIFFQSYDYSSEFVVVFFIASIMAFQTIPLGVLRTTHKPWKYFFVSFSFFVIFIIVTWLFLEKGLGYWSFLYGNLAGAIFSVVLGFSLIGNYFKVNINFRLIISILSFGFSILLNSFAVTVLATSSRYFLKLNNELETLGVLGMSTRLSLVVGALLVLPFNLAWLPFVNSIYKTEKFYLLVQKIYELFNIIGILLIMGVSLFSYDFFYLTNNLEYIESYKYIPFFSFSYLFLGNYFIFASGIYLKNKPKQYIVISLVTIIGNLLLYFLLLNYLTLFSVSIITLVSYIIMFLGAYFYGNNLLKINLLSKKIRKLIILIIFFSGIQILTIVVYNYIPLILRIVEYLLLSLLFIRLFIINDKNIVLFLFKRND